MKTVAQLNTAIAQRRGWTVRKDDRGEEIWTEPEYGDKVQLPPAYDREWQHTGPLLSEMAAARYWEIVIDSPVAEEQWRVYPQQEGMPQVQYFGEGKTLTEAISRAWDAWKEESDEAAKP